MDLFIITSVIHVNPSIGWTYTNIRSAYTDTERYKHTQESIESIRLRCPSAKIALLEASKLTDNEKEYFQKNVDYFCDYSEDNWVLEATESIKKGYGEIRQILRFLETLPQIPFRRLFKLSGRYWLSPHFDETAYSLELPTFKLYGTQVSTILYSYPLVYLNEYKRILFYSNYFYSHSINSLEQLFYKEFQVNPLYIKRLGVQGLIAIDRSVLIDE